MSLRVWLPLNGNLENKGCGDLVVTTNNTNVFQSEGKISSQSIDVSGHYAFRVPSLVKARVFSFAFWYKPIADSSLSDNWRRIIVFDTYTSDGSTTGAIFRCESSYGYQSSNTSYCISIHNNVGEPIATIGNALGETDGWGKWQHIAVTADGTTLRCYRNGVQVASGSMANGGMLQGTVHVGYTGNRPVGRMNDLRLYDHCLSPLEVKEISQGLVLHYPLNDFYNESTTNLAAGSAGKNYVTKEVAAYATSIKGKTQYENKIYTYSAYIKNTSDNPLAVRFNPYNADDSGYSAFNGNYIQPGHEGYSTVTVDINDTTKWNGKVILYVQNGNAGTVPTNKTFYIKEVQLEQKDFATIYTDGTRTQTIISDCSGFGNNGTIINSSTHKKDGARYNASMSFNGTTDGILIENLQISSIINTAVTYSFWIKPDGESGARSVYFGSYSGTSWSIEKTSGNVLRSYWAGSPDETCTGATITDNVWQHVCITKNGTSDIKVYINGVLKWSSTATHSNLTFPTTFRIGRDTRSGDGTPYKGLMSDFRIYATALSEADIKALYNISANVDNLGNFYSFEFVEDDRKSIDKNGITHTSELYEYNEINASIKDSGVYNANSFIEK